MAASSNVRDFVKNISLSGSASMAILNQTISKEKIRKVKLKEKRRKIQDKIKKMVSELYVLEIEYKNTKLNIKRMKELMNASCPPPHPISSKSVSMPEESDSDEDAVNPMVAGFKEELDPEDAVGTVPDYSIQAVATVPSDLSSEDETPKSQQLTGKATNPILQPMTVIEKEDSAEEIPVPPAPASMLILEAEDLNILENMYDYKRKTSSETTQSFRSQTSPSPTPEGFVAEDSVGED